MTAVLPPVAPVAPAPRRDDVERQSWLSSRLGPAWPLKLLLLGFPLWWALGLAGFACQLFAIPMALQIRRRGLRGLPAGFGLWLLFLAWVLLGVSVLWADAPGTLASVGPDRLVGYAHRYVWYLTVTVAMLYPLSLPSVRVPGRQIADWLGTLFLVCVAGGLAGLLFPNLHFSSAVELVLPSSLVPDGSFLHNLVHPSLTTSSDFLGYEQPRPKAPFLYANAWGNNLALTLPFFVYSWLGSAQRWRRMLGVPLLAVAAVPVAFSLNRGLWLAIVAICVAGAVALARSGRLTALWALVSAMLLASVVLVATPLWDTVTLRLETPHSNERRTSVAETVVSTTVQGSPLLGYGTTRTVAGNFASIAGTGNAECRQCSAPPLGTQGFVWRLILTTGLVGTGLFAAFVALQWRRHLGRRTPFAALGSMTLATSVLLSFVYDSLETPLFIAMLAVGLMNRERIEDVDQTLPEPTSMTSEAP